MNIIQLTYKLLNSFSVYCDKENTSSIYFISDKKHVFKFKDVLKGFNNAVNVSELLKLEQYFCERSHIATLDDLTYFTNLLATSLINIFKSLINLVVLNSLDNYSAEYREYLKSYLILNEEQEACRSFIAMKQGNDLCYEEEI